MATAHFKATPRLGGRGTLAGMANRLAEAALNDRDVIKFPHILNLDDQYLIATPEAPASSVTLPDGLLRVLAGLYPNLQLNAGGNTLVLAYTNTVTNPPDEQRMTALYNIGLQLVREIESELNVRQTAYAPPIDRSIGGALNQQTIIQRLLLFRLTQFDSSRCSPLDCQIQRKPTAFGNPLRAGL